MPDGANSDPTLDPSGAGLRHRALDESLNNGDSARGHLEAGSACFPLFPLFPLFPVVKTLTKGLSINYMSINYT